MEDVAENVEEGVRDAAQIPQSKVGVVQLPVLDAVLEYLPDQRADRQMRRIHQSSTGRFDTIGQHQYAHDTRPGARPRVAVFALGNRRSPFLLLLQGPAVEKRDQARAVMLLDGVPQRQRKAMLRREILGQAASPGAEEAVLDEQMKADLEALGYLN